MADSINSQDQQFLLKLARDTIISGVKKPGLSAEEIDNLTAILKENRGCFVTLHKNGSLRGCIGYIMPMVPLYQAVAENAYNAAFGDPRFPGVTPEEIEQLHIEISVLTIPEKLTYDGAEDLLDKLQPGEDGLIIKKNYHQSTFLPQVWDQLPSKEDFLTHLCMKAGLSGNEWQKGELEVETYKAFFFEEKK